MDENPNPDAPPRRVKHYQVRSDVFNRIIQFLSRLPYGQVAGPLQDLTEGSRAIFEDEMPAQIVDNPPGSDDDGPDPVDPDPDKDPSDGIEKTDEEGA